jgi:hypothetical protein
MEGRSDVIDWINTRSPSVVSVTQQYLRIFRWHVLRYLWRHPLLGLLSILSVALGLAVFLATQLANQSANHPFAASADLTAGKAELEIVSPARHLPGVAGFQARTPL